jgi:CRISPR-associated protein Cas2
MRLLVAYDISDDDDRRQVFKTLEAYGAWRQYSVFEVDVTETERLELEDELESYVDPEDDDRIRLYRLCSNCLDATTDLGASPPETQSNVI